MLGNRIIRDVKWYNGAHGLVGIVCVEMDGELDDEPDRVIRYFIGAVHVVQGEALDAHEIATWGARFPQDIGAIMFPRIKDVVAGIVELPVIAADHK